jgi:Immunity protein 27
MTEINLPLEAYEEDLIGLWVMEYGKVVGDVTCQRIDWLIAHRLIKLGYSLQGGGWETAYEDPTDGRIWEKTYPQSATHGGGPPRLRVLTTDDFERRYGR